MTPYEQKVRQIAEEMAFDDCYLIMVKELKDGTASKSAKRVYESLVEANMEKARIAVKHMRESATEMYKQLNHGYVDESELHILLFNMGLKDRLPNAEKPKDGENWFHAECEKCGWEGSSQFLLGGGQISDTGDYNDAYCPNCGDTNNF